MSISAGPKCRKSWRRIFLVLFLLAAVSVPVLSTGATYEQNREAAEARKLLPIESNHIEGWPDGPAIGAAAAILYEANTGVILYAKDIHGRHFPASITKLMTAVLAIDLIGLNDMIPFSRTAVHSIGWDSSNIGIDVGEAMTFEQALYGIMVASANEVANAIGEYAGGDLETFAAMMTQKAAELGCQNTNFLNAHGLPEEEHYTSAHDMALIAAAFFKNEMLAKIGNTISYHFTPTDTQPDDFVIRNRHRLINGEITTDYNILGGKTGYTNISRQTLVTCAEKGGMRLICVILKEETPEQFEDTVKLFDYGFSNFQVVNVADNESRYKIENASFFQTGNDIFGDSSPLLALGTSDYIVMPRNVDFRSLVADVSFRTEIPLAVAEITYSYNGVYMGRATIDYGTSRRQTYDFDHQMPVVAEEVPLPEEENVVFINVRQAVFLVIAVAVAVIVFFVIRAVLERNRFERRRRRRKKPTKKKRRRERYRGYRI